MSLKVYADMEQRSDSWFEARCGVVTASVVGQLVTTMTLGAISYGCPACGVIAGIPCISKRSGAPILTLHSERAEVARADKSPMLVPADNDTTRRLAERLAAERISGEIDPDEELGGRDIWRGRDAEVPARAKYAEHYGVKVAEVGFMLLEEDGLRIGVSPDGLVGEEGGVEIKSPRRKGHVATVVNGVVPAFHVAQIQTALMVSGRAWWDFVSYAPGLQMWVKRVYPDPEWHAAIRAAVTEFEQTVEQMVVTYRTGVEGFPMTDPLPDPFEVELKL
jgi:hypothetical protein